MTQSHSLEQHTMLANIGIHCTLETMEIHAHMDILLQKIECLHQYF